MAQGKTMTVYLVQRLSWEYGDDFYYRAESNDAPMRTFRDRTRAETLRRDLEWEHVRANQINPFGYVDASLEERSSLPLDELLARLSEAGIQTGGEGDQARIDLWSQYDALPDEQRRLVWDAVDRLRFFQVVEMSVDLDE
jgi:hypothetical protein